MDRGVAPAAARFAAARHPRRGAADRAARSQAGRAGQRLGDRLVYIGGLPTAETFALPYLEIGVSTYSSAIFNFLPRFAQEFYSAVRRRAHVTVFAMLRDFLLPYVAIRSRRKGYAVSIVKAGMRAVSLQPRHEALTDRLTVPCYLLNPNEMGNHPSHRIHVRIRGV